MTYIFDLSCEITLNKQKETRVSRPPVAELENLAKMASTEATKENLDLRRRRILEIRHSKIEEKRAKLQNLQKEMSDLNEDIPLSGVEIESDSVVVAVSSARKSARKQKDPAAAMQGRQEATILARVHELQRAGLWSHKKLPKLQMPTRYIN